MKNTGGIRLRGCASTLALTLALACPAFAGDNFDPDEPPQQRGVGISGELSVEIQSDNTYDSGDPDAELRDTYTTTELDLNATVGPALLAHTHLTLEPVLDPGPGEDRFFEDLGLYAEELYGQVNVGHGISVLGGKFDPAFGTAWDLTPGIYGTDFAEDYQLTERIGFAVAMEREAGSLGSVTLAGSLYYLDTSELSRSAFTDRGRTSISDGGVSNTETLDSYTITLDAKEAPALAGANLHLGYRLQKKGKTIDDLADEHGYVAGLNGSRTYNGVEFNWIGEVAYLENAEGTLDDVWYYTVGGQLVFGGKYNLAASYTGRPRDVSGGSDFDDKEIQVSAGVELVHGWTLDAGYKYHVESDVENHTVGLLFAKAIEFGH